MFPAEWQTGVPGVLLIFLVGPLGTGIPLGIIMGHDLGLSPVATAGIYLVRDVITAFIVEPELALFRWLSRRNAFLGRVGVFLSRLTQKAGLNDDGPRGPLGLVIFSFIVDPVSARAAASAAGHGFIAGWTLAIIGDMAYFGVLLASTLWLTSIFGDDRLSIGLILVAMWLVPVLLKRFRRATPAATAPAPAPVSAPIGPLAVDGAPRLAHRSASTPTGRRRRSARHLHR